MTLVETKAGLKRLASIPEGWKIQFVKVHEFDMGVIATRSNHRPRYIDLKDLPWLFEKWPQIDWFSMCLKIDSAKCLK